MIPRTTIAQADAVIKPLTLIEKLEQEKSEAKDTLADISKYQHYRDLEVMQGGKIAGLEIAIEIVKQHQAESWVSVDERLPDKDGKYLVYCVGNRELTKDRKELSIMRFNQKTKGGWFALSPLFKVVYWQPIQPPSEAQDD